ncbi:MAG: succinate--CoA ligase subunit alpha [Burkholderiaceae bacterium]|nr:succinate--CoA ligase subunit alpha [Burkholderiaceae bacterium]
MLDRASKVLAVAATGPYGMAQVNSMRAAGTRLVGLVALGRGGQQADGLPVFDRVSDAVQATGADTSIVYAPPMGVRNAVIECADAGLALTVAVAEHVPLHDTLYAAACARERGMRLIGPNTVGMATPGVGILGSIAAAFTREGSIGVIGRSGTLLLTTTRMLTLAGLGQSTLVHVGGDTIAGSNPHEILELFLADPGTSAIVYLGEIGGGKEYRLAEVIARAEKPVAALVVGRHAPAEKRMGHAGAMVESKRETAQAKGEALAEAGATVCRSPMEVVARMKQLAQEVSHAGH